MLAGWRRKPKVREVRTFVCSLRIKSRASKMGFCEGVRRCVDEVEGDGARKGGEKKKSEILPLSSQMSGVRWVEMT